MKMKFKRMVAMGVAALAGCAFAAADNARGFVMVEWSLKTGEKWEVKGLAEIGRASCRERVYSGV